MENCLRARARGKNCRKKTTRNGEEKKSYFYERKRMKKLIKINILKI